jgi:hypothetical protein
MGRDENDASGVSASRDRDVGAREGARRDVAARARVARRDPRRDDANGREGGICIARRCHHMNHPVPLASDGNDGDRARATIATRRGRRERVDAIATKTRTRDEERSTSESRTRARAAP